MWVKCVLVWYSQPLTSIFGLVNSSIKNMRLECPLHHSHSMEKWQMLTNKQWDYNYSHIQTKHKLIHLNYASDWSSIFSWHTIIARQLMFFVHIKKITEKSCFQYKSSLTACWLKKQSRECIYLYDTWRRFLVVIIE